MNSETAASRPRSRFLSPDIDPKKPWLVRKKAILKKLKTPGKIIYCTGAFKLYIDGDGISPVWRWWHPLSWALFIIAIPICAFLGERITETLPFRLSAYWRKPENKKELEWV